MNAPTTAPRSYSLDELLACARAAKTPDTLTYVKNLLYRQRDHMSGAESQQVWEAMNARAETLGTTYNTHTHCFTNFKD